jgi:O-antigen ligase
VLKIDPALERLLTKVLFFSLFGVTLVVTPYTTNDPFNLPKMCVLAICGLFILGGVISNARSILHIYSKTIFVILGLLVLDILVIVATSKPSLTEQLYGLFGRNTGALTYISLVGILAGGIVLSSDNKIESFTKITLIIGFISSVYGHFQYFGIEPFPYVSIYERNVFSTFGNSNFQSAFMAMIAAMSCALAFKSGVSHWYRIGVSLLSASCIFGIYETSAQQGFLSLLFALCVVVMVFLLNRKYFFLGAISFLGIASAFILVVLSIFNVGLKIDFLSNASVVARKYFWESATNIIFSHPLLGVGMDGFGDWYLRERSAEAVKFNAGLTTDAAHNVALDLGVSGGVPLLALYLAIIFLTIRAIYRISRRDQQISANFYGLIGLWVAFQIQSLVSINQIGIAIWGWVSSGLIIGYEMNSASSSNSLKQKNSVSTPSGKLPLRANSVLGVFAGSLVGVMLVAPAYLSANNYFRALKTGDPSMIFKSAGIFPHERHRFLQVSSSMLNSGLNEEALYVARIAIKQYPDSIQSWILLKAIPTATESEKEQASSEIKRLDPLKP